MTVGTVLAQHPWNADFYYSSVRAVLGTERKESDAFGHLGNNPGHTFTVKMRATPGKWAKPRPGDPASYWTGQGTENPVFHNGNFYFYQGGAGIYPDPDWSDPQDPAWENHRIAFSCIALYDENNDDLDVTCGTSSGSVITDSGGVTFKHFHSPVDTYLPNENGVVPVLSGYQAGDILPRAVEQQQLHIASPLTGLETWTSSSVVQSNGGAWIPSIAKDVVEVTDYFPQLRSPLGTELLGANLESYLVTKRNYHTYVRSYDAIFVTARPFNYPAGRAWNPYSTSGRLYLFEYKEDVLHEKFPYQVRKDLALSQSVVSRRTYGQPNPLGDIPVGDKYPGVDPNAPARNINFKDWFFRGGLFVGQMNPESNDLSGASRIQIYPMVGPNSTTEIATLSLLYLSSPAGVTGSLKTITSAVSASDPNYNVSLDNLTWDNKWAVFATLDEVTIDANTATADYVSWQGSTVPGQSRILILNKEEDLNKPPATTWRYFASPARMAGDATYPMLDGHPRVWYVDRLEPIRWTQP